MFGFRYIKAGPTQHIIHYRDGRIARSGTGLAFFYFQPVSSIAVVPVSSVDVPFIFNEMTSDFQAITVQGQLAYRVIDAELVASLLDYTVQGSPDAYVSEDPTKLQQRLVNLTQVLVRAEAATRPLRAAILAADEISGTVLAKLKESEIVKDLGVEMLDLAILEIRPTPEISKALEAESREELLRKSDEAIYARRNAAVEQERLIKENELNTEIAVEEKKRQIRETKAAADLSVEAKQQELREAQMTGKIKLEEDRKQLVGAQAENARTLADAEAYKLETSLRPLSKLNDKVLQVLAVQSAEPRLVTAMAFKQLAENAAKIGHLNITPDLLQTLMEEK